VAINEACQVWIEQRIKEELDEKGTSGKSLRVIGKEIAKEIERIFEAQVNPDTIRKKAERMGGTNVPLEENTEKSDHNDELEKLEKPAAHGGARQGSGRKSKEYNKIETEYFGQMEGTEDFCEAFEKFYAQVQGAQMEKWQNVPKRSAIYCIKLLNDLIGGDNV
jgi:hypothetical protein